MEGEAGEVFLEAGEERSPRRASRSGGRSPRRSTMGDGGDGKDNGDRIGSNGGGSRESGHGYDSPPNDRHHTSRDEDTMHGVDDDRHPMSTQKGLSVDEMRNDGTLHWVFNDEEDTKFFKLGSICLSVQERDVPKVIGRHGQALRQVRLLTGAHVEVVKREDGDGMLRLSGTEEQMRHCLSLIRLKICPYEERESYTRLLQFFHDMCQPLCLLKVMLVEECMGRVMGKGGESIRKVQERFDVMVAFPKITKVDARPEERDTSICGSPEKVAQAFETIMANAYPYPQAPPRITVHVRVHEDQVGRVIGRQGASLHEFKVHSGCELSLSRERLETVAMRDFQISGFPDQISRCLRLVYEKLTARPSRGLQRDDRVDERRGDRTDRDRDRERDRGDRGDRDRDDRHYDTQEERVRGGYSDDAPVATSTAAADSRRRHYDTSSAGPSGGSGAASYSTADPISTSSYDSSARYATTTTSTATAPAASSTRDYDRRQTDRFAGRGDRQWTETTSYPPARPSRYEEAADADADEKHTMILVPDEFAGSILGVLTTIEKRTNTRISVEKPDRNSRFRELHITGSVLRILECIGLVQDKLKEHAHD